MSLPLSFSPSLSLVGVFLSCIPERGQNRHLIEANLTHYEMFLTSKVVDSINMYFSLVFHKYFHRPSV